MDLHTRFCRFYVRPTYGGMCRTAFHLLGNTIFEGKMSEISEEINQDQLSPYDKLKFQYDAMNDTLTETYKKLKDVRIQRNEAQDEVVQLKAEVKKLSESLIQQTEDKEFLVKALDMVNQERDELQKSINDFKEKKEPCPTCGVSPAYMLQRIAELTAQRNHWRSRNFFKRGKQES